MKFNAKENPPFFLRRPKGTDNYLLLLFKSHGELTVRNKIFKYTPNDLIILKIGTPHAINTLDSVLVHDWIHFTVDDDETFLSSKIFFDKLLPCPLSNIVSDTIKNIYQEYIGQYQDQTIVNYLMNAMFLYVSRSHSIVKELSDDDKKLLYKFDELRNDIYNDCNKYSSLAEMSSRMFLSESRFCHLYKKFYHISPIQDLTNVKIQTAKQLLLTTDYQVKEIAQMCGFANEFSFIRCFKNKTGSSPRKWVQ